ncbi:MAG TPA: sialidase family protein [Gemmatimonadaceae bacterium]|nr:sialidase family protein [Gemmatimonadaceae bacterium]
MPTSKRLGIACLVFASIVVGSQTARAQQITAVPPPWFAFDTCMYLGNTVRAREPGHLIAVLELRHNGRFWIQLARSADDGRTWRIAEVVDRDDNHDFYDPSLARLHDGSLLLEHHGGGAMTILRSTDDGAHWKRGTVFLGRFSEGYWQPLPPAKPLEPPRLALLYGQTLTNQTTTYFVRTTTDGTHWTNPVVAGEGGAIWDGLRAGLGPAESDSGGIIHVAYSYRHAPADSVRIMLVSLDARSLARRSPPDTLVKVRSNFKGIGAFPVVASCPDGAHVIYDGYAKATGAEVALWEVTERDRTPKPVVIRGPMYTGFGRPWFVPSWSGTPALSWPELPNGPHTQVYSLPRPDLAHCAY